LLSVVADLQVNHNPSRLEADETQCRLQDSLIKVALVDLLGQSNMTRVRWLEIFVGIVVSTLQRHIPHRYSE